MSTINVRFTLSDRNHHRSRVLELPLGSALFTCIPIDVLTELGIQPEEEQEFSGTDGQIVKREVAWVIVSAAGRSTPTPVVFGLAEDYAAIGRLTLSELGVVADERGRLVVKPGRLKELALVT